MKLFRTSQNVVDRELPRNPVVRQIIDKIQWRQLEPALDAFFVEQDKLELRRKGKVPWFLSPDAWKTRLLRDRARKQVNELVRQALARIV